MIVVHGGPDEGGWLHGRGDEVRGLLGGGTQEPWESNSDNFDAFFGASDQPIISDGKVYIKYPDDFQFVGIDNTHAQFTLTYDDNSYSGTDITLERLQILGKAGGLLEFSFRGGAAPVTCWP